MFYIKSVATVALPALILGANVAWADCPVNRADTADSIFVTFDDFHVRYDLQADGSVIEEETYSQEGDGFRVHSRNGAFVFESWDTQFGIIVQNSGEVTNWGVGAANLPALRAGQTWSDHTVRAAETGEEYSETVTVQVETERPLNIGACSYRVWPMVVTTASPGSVFTDYITYLPALEIGIYHGGLENGEAFARDEPTSISTEPPVQGVNGVYMLPGTQSGSSGNPTPAPLPGTPPSPDVKRS